MDNLLYIFNHMMTSGLHTKYGAKKILNVNFNTVYVGAGTDLETIVQIPDNLNVLMIDSQPYSEFGSLVLEDNKNNYNGFSRIQFIPSLLKVASKYNLDLQCQSLTEIIISGLEKNVLYYVNTVIPHDLKKINNVISGFTNLIVMGHDTNYEIMNYTDKKVTFWGNLNTVYNLPTPDFLDRCEKYGVIYKLNTDVDFRNKFKSFNLLTGKNKYISFTNWDTFVIYTTSRRNCK